MIESLKELEGISKQLEKETDLRLQEIRNIQMGISVATHLAERGRDVSENIQRLRSRLAELYQNPLAMGNHAHFA